jgi:hypothetical protein
LPIYKNEYTATIPKKITRFMLDAAYTRAVENTLRGGGVDTSKWDESLFADLTKEIRLGTCILYNPVPGEVVRRVIQAVVFVLGEGERTFALRENEDIEELIRKEIQDVLLIEYEGMNDSRELSEEYPGLQTHVVVHRCKVVLEEGDTQGTLMVSP